MIYAILGAFVVGLSLGLFGSGGSILTVPTLIYLLHHGDKVAIAESLAIVGGIALVSALPYAKDRQVDWRFVLFFGLPGMAGTYLGAWVAAYVAGYVQLFVFAGVMVLAAVRMWRRSRAAAAEHADAEPPKRSAGRIGVDGLGVGVLTGFVGVGGGFLIVPALILLGGLAMRRAVGTSLVIITLNAAVGFAKHLHVLDTLEASVNWQTIGVFLVVGAIGSFAGNFANARVNQRALQKGFAVFLLAMAGFILVKESAALIAAPAPPGPSPTVSAPG